jgi:hypothetical protein
VGTELEAALMALAGSPRMAANDKPIENEFSSFGAIRH